MFFNFLIFFVRGTLSLLKKKASLGLAIIAAQLNDFKAVETGDINFFGNIRGDGTELSCATLWKQFLKTK